MLDMALDMASEASDVTLASWPLNSLEMLDTAAEVKEDRPARSVAMAVSIASPPVAVVAAMLAADVSPVAEETALLMMDSTSLTMELAAAEVVSWP